MKTKADTNTPITRGLARRVFIEPFQRRKPPIFNWGRGRAIVWRQLKWLSPLVFCWSDPDVPRDLGAVTSERCSAIVGLTNGSGLVARVNQHNGFPVMRSLTGEVKPISRDSWSDLCIRSHIVSVKSFRLQSGVVYDSTTNPVGLPCRFPPGDVHLPQCVHHKQRSAVGAARCSEIHPQ